jgi:uncharacterized membrane protein YcaP (DUF421 family)
MDVIVRAVLLYLVALLLLRIATRRIIRSATAADMVIVFVFGGLMVNAVMADEHSVTAACLALATVALLRLAIERLALSWPVVGMLTEGTACPVFEKGQWDMRRLRQLRVTERDVLSEMRQKGVRRMDDVQTVVIEHNGGISVITKPE